MFSLKRFRLLLPAIVFVALFIGPSTSSRRQRCDYERVDQQRPNEQR